LFAGPQELQELIRVLGKSSEAGDNVFVGVDNGVMWDCHGGELAFLEVLILFRGCVRAVGLAAAQSAPQPAPGQAVATFAGGCFWCTEADFDKVTGVISTTSGYIGGKVANPTYEQVSSGGTGHAESVSVTFDPSQITFGQILMIFFSVAHDPTQLNRQGPDTGSQYRSAIFYSNDEQKRIAEAYVAQLDAAQVYSRKIVTQIAPFETFYRAEEYHQEYLANHPNEPYIVYNDLPKLDRLKQQFPELYRN